MATTFGDIKGFVLELLQKNASYQGFYTDTKLKNAIQEAVDFIGVDMGLCGEGWLKTITAIDYLAVSHTVDLPSGVMYIEDVRWKVGDRYVPLSYDPRQGDSQTTSTADTIQSPSTYRLIGQKLYLDPAPSDVGTGMCQVEYVRYPATYVNDATNVDADFDRAMFWFIRYKAASCLITSNGRSNPPWAGIEADWYSQVTKVIAKRVRNTKYVRNFDE
jgi:hypothetical protein